MESTQILVQLLIAGIAYRVWNSLRALEQKAEQEPVSPVQPIQAFGPRLLKRIEECSVRMEPADREFLSRQLAHPDNAVALHAARCLAKSLHPAASQLMFEHVERLDREILKHQALRRLERQDFYEKLAEDSNSNPPKPRPGRGLGVRTSGRKRICRTAGISAHHEGKAFG
jgi:hypothetical protein